MAQRVDSCAVPQARETMAVERIGNQSCRERAERTEPPPLPHGREHGEGEAGWDRTEDPVRRDGANEKLVTAGREIGEVEGTLIRRRTPASLGKGKRRNRTPSNRARPAWVATHK